MSAAPALDLDLDHGKPASGPQAKRVVAGQGMLPGRAAPSAKVKQASIPPAPQSKPNPFRSTPSPESEAPPPQNAAEKAAASLGFGGGDDDDWDMAGDLAVGLDYGSEFPPPVSGPKAAPAGGQPSDPGPARPMMGSGAPASSRTSMPSLSGGEGQVPAPPPAAAAVGGAGAIFSPQEIEAVAQYGPVPSNPVLWPVYTFKVFQRKKKLQELLVLQKRTHEQATSTLRGKLADVADGIVAKAPDQLEAVMGPIRAADQKIADRKVQLEAASGQFASQFKSLQLELEGEAKQRAQLDRDRNMAQIKLEDAVHKKAQVTAELKRVNMAIDAAHEAATKAAPGANFAPPEHAKRIAGLEAEKAKLVEQARARDRTVADAKAEVKAREGAIKQQEARVHTIHARQSRMEDEAGQAQSLGLDALKGAQNERLVAYEVALDTIMAQAKSLVDKPTRAQIEDVKRQIATCDADLEKMKLAVDSYDDDAYKKGIAVVAVVAVLVLAGLISVARVQ